MSVAFHYVAKPLRKRVMVRALNHSAEAMLEVCGFEWNRGVQHYVGEPTRLQGMELLIDHGFVPVRGCGVTTEDMSQFHEVEYREAVRKLRSEQPTRCRRTLELFQ